MAKYHGDADLTGDIYNDRNEWVASVAPEYAERILQAFNGLEGEGEKPSRFDIQKVAPLPWSVDGGTVVLDCGGNSLFNVDGTQTRISGDERIAAEIVRVMNNHALLVSTLAAAPALPVAVTRYENWLKRAFNVVAQARGEVPE